MKKTLRSLALIVTMAFSGNSGAFLMDDGNNIITCGADGCHDYVKGSCEYKGLKLYLSCDLELPSSPRCTITEIDDNSGQKHPGKDLPNDLCLPLVTIKYPTILYCSEPKNCDKDFRCC